jgi:hypothetical protein
MSTLFRLNGIITSLYLGMQAGTHLTTLQSQVQVTFAGFAGDQHAGLTRKADSRTPFYKRGSLIRNQRQVTIVSSAELELAAADLGILQIKPEWIGANLLIDGIPHLTLLPPQTRLFFAGGVVLISTGENQPCTVAGRAIEQQVGRPGLAQLFPKAALHRRGLTAIVERPGLVRPGETVIAEVYEQIPYSPEVQIS